MTGRIEDRGSPIAGEEDIVRMFHSKLAPAGGHGLIGIESEKLILLSNDSPASYPAARAVYQWLADNRGYKPGKLDQGNLVGVSKLDSGSDHSINWTFEPGLQMETASRPHDNLHALAAEIDAFTKDGVAAAASQGARLIALGFQPGNIAALKIPRRPGSRYDVMRAFNGRAIRGAQGNNMMHKTAGLQLSVDFKSESDAMRKTQAAANIAAAVSAMTNNSPYRDGHLDSRGIQSVRNENNADSMNGRLGHIVEAAFEDNGRGFFGNIVDYYVNHVKMLGIYNDKGEFIDAKDRPFSDFLKSGAATTTNFIEHQKSDFPYDVRPQPAPGLVELRSFDTVPPEMMKGLAALYVGLLHDNDALNEVRHLTGWMKSGDRLRLRKDAAREGLQATFNEHMPRGRDYTVQAFDLRLIDIAVRSLKKRGLGEEVYLKPLKAIAASGINWAQRNALDFGDDYKRANQRMDLASNKGQGPLVSWG
jgi:glutamate--cysteine ligase